MRASEAHVDALFLLVGRRESDRHTGLTLRYSRTETGKLARALCSLWAPCSRCFCEGVA